jgi:hypothetical protein
MSTLTTTAQYHAVLHDVRKHLRYDSVAEYPEDIRVRQRLEARARERSLRSADHLVRGFESQQQTRELAAAA